MSNPLIEISELTVNYGNTKAISQVNLNVDAGEYLGIIGPNGGGKSTLLKCISGLIKPSHGSVKIMSEKHPYKSTKIGYVPQISNLDKNFPISLTEVVLTGMIDSKITPFFRYTQEDKDLAYALLGKVGLEKLAKRQISQLSGGEFQKMLIARALASNPKILLLDEPTASVDAKSRGQIYELLKELNSNITIILVTHDLMAVAEEVKSLACLSTNLVYHGKPELNETIISEMYGCPVELIAHGVPHRVYPNHD